MIIKKWHLLDSFRDRRIWSWGNSFLERPEEGVAEIEAKKVFLTTCVDFDSRFVSSLIFTTLTSAFLMTLLCAALHRRVTGSLKRFGPDFLKFNYFLHTFTSDMTDPGFKLTKVVIFHICLFPPLLSSFFDRTEGELSPAR